MTKTTERVLQYRLEFEQLIATISTRFINLPATDISEEINLALQMIGEFVVADRSYVFRFYEEGTLADNTHEWCAGGIPPQIEQLQGVPTATLPWWMAQLRRFETVHIPKVAELPPEAAAEKAFLAAQGIQSLIAIPLISGRSLLGFLGFDAIGKVQIWSPDIIALLRLVGDIFANTLERKQFEEDLQVAEGRYRTLVEQLPAIIYVEELKEETTQTLYVSPQVETMLGFSPAECLANPELWDKQVHPDDRERVLSAIYQDPLRNNPLRLEYRLFSKTGKVVWVEEHCRLVPPADENDQGRYLHGVLFDITSRKELEEQYRRAQRMEAIGQLTAGIAHDFNNLLTAINGYAVLMQRQLDPENLLKEMADKIVASGQRAANLIRQLMVFSRKQIVQPQVLDLNAIVSEMHKLLSRIIGEHIVLTLKLQPTLWPVKMDPTQVEQVVMNLVVNARDAMPTGGHLIIKTCNTTLAEGIIPAHLEIQAGDYVRLTISDTGIGMSAAVKDRIFEPFFTTKEVGQGTGLGLATVYGIVKQNRGDIRVTSTEGMGATFDIYLPATSLSDLSLVDPRTAAEWVRGSETILLVEDAQEVRSFAAQVLEMQGYTILEAQNGPEALQLATHHPGPIHLLLTDVVMPGMSGKELAEQLTQKRPNLKVLYISGYMDTMITQQGVLKKGMAFLQKPFTPATLTQRVRQLLDMPLFRQENG